ncbi:MAG: hypothetical protein VKL59_23600 [Nostocaceae cyanobacterium]|nr:hypothetical protein [Nostocaceae cyanobacterium]
MKLSSPQHQYKSEQEIQLEIAALQEQIAETERQLQAKCEDIKNKFGSAVLSVILINHVLKTSVSRRQRWG